MIADGDARALLGEASRDRGPDPRRAAGDQNGFAGEIGDNETGSGHGRSSGLRKSARQCVPRPCWRWFWIVPSRALYRLRKRRRVQPMSEARKLAAILVTDIVGYSRLAGADEDRILARLRTLRSDLIEPTISVHRGRVVKRTGDGAIVEFRSVVDAVRCGIELQHGLAERNAGLPPERRIDFRVGIHLGDVVEESDGDLMGDGVNIA